MRLLGRLLIQRQLQSKVFGECARSNRVLGIQEVQQGQILEEKFPEEKDRLETDIRAKLLVGRIGGEQLRVGRFVGVQLARAQPLLDEALHEVERPVIAKHALNQLFQNRGFLQLALCRDIEQQLVRHAAPQEIRKPGS